MDKVSLRLGCALSATASVLALNVVLVLSGIAAGLYGEDEHINRVVPAHAPRNTQAQQGSIDCVNLRPTRISPGSAYLPTIRA